MLTPYVTQEWNSPEFSVSFKVYLWELKIFTASYLNYIADIAEKAAVFLILQP